MNIQNKKLFLIVTAAMFTALTTVATMVINIPTAGTNGYINCGDTAVLLASWLLGNPYGAIAAGLGSGLADYLAGYGSYVPGTLVIKFAMSFVCCIIFRLLGKTKLPKPLSYIISGVVAELIMVFGYFLYESTLLGYGLAAASAIPSNFIQGGACLVLGNLLVNALDKVPYFKSLIQK